MSVEQQTCENCGKASPPDETYCSSCGHILPAGLNALATHALENGQTLKPQIRWGTAYFGEHTVLRIHVRDTNAILEAKFEKECVIGRTVNDVLADVDLTPYNAMDMGVSRRHVKLTRLLETIMVQDLGSVNGTYLNGQKLVPNQQRVLRNNDELRLGRLVLRVSYMSAPKIDMSAPKIDVSAPNTGTNAPVTDVSTPKTSTNPLKSDTDAPETDVSTPKTDVSAPKTD
jgi:pSer/pThr/pTyr-binding forkhead associated (FHA) protein